MATPTPPGSKKLGGSGSTPSHLNQSSPPRSVPSPVTARHPAGKTPVSHPTTGSSSGSKTLAGTPIVQNLSQSGNTSSPSANMLGLGTPNGLGIEGVTPTGVPGLTPNMGMGASQMMHGMSELGFTPSGGKRNEDEERRMRMRKVLRTIGRDKGRVSEQGIARIARRVGFANDIDSEELTPEERERRAGNRKFSIAGKAIVIEPDLKDSVVKSVEVFYSTSSKVLEDHGARAGKVLLDDLASPDGIALKAKLDRFAVNLERLARMDRLSNHGINCFEAVAGLYASLERLYKQEKELVKALLEADLSNADEKADFEVMCKKSGKPLVNANGKIGIELAYWQNSRHVTIKTRNDQAASEMDIDRDEENGSRASKDDEDQTFKLRLEVESCPPTLYPPIRISDTWLPEPLELPALDSGEGIPWQDPPQTYATPPDAEAANSSILPDLRFLVQLDPPLVVPWNLAVNIHNALGNHVMIPQVQQYSQMLLDPFAAPLQHGESFTTSAKQSVLSYKDGQETTAKHVYKLQDARLDFGARIEQLPFTHPRQLVELLPTLRQWAYIGSTLKATFNNNHDDTENGASLGHGSMNGAVKARSTLDDLLMDVDTDPSDSIAVNMALNTTPVASLGISFPKSNGSDVANIIVEVQANADLTASDREEVSRTGESPKTEENRQREIRLARALEMCGDLGVWVEWVRTRT